jgi:hydrogenase maturation protein HypF
MTSLAPAVVAPFSCRGEQIRIRGIVQGVGFRPMVWRVAHALGVRGCVSNDAEGVLIEAWGEPATLERLIEHICREAPPLARIEKVERSPAAMLNGPFDFRIGTSAAGPARTQVAPDAAVCAACAQETLDPFGRRFRYPFTNCTHCGPRLSIVEGIPYDRANTTMAKFSMCPACAAEYENPEDRRFHAQPNACHACGPRVTLARSDERALALDALTFLDETDAGCTLLQRDFIVAIQGIGGYQLGCDATSAIAVSRLRAGKQRERKPFALMARDLDVIRSYCTVNDMEAELIRSPAAPIVLLERAPNLMSRSSPRPRELAPEVAPGLQTLGFMLPYTPLHHLLLERMDRPIVLTSGNLSDEPQAINRDDARNRLTTIADYFLEHNRPIARRVDDSVTRVVAGRPRIIRRARGYAPAPLGLPPGFDATPRVVGFGGELKSTFCLLDSSGAVLSPHIGDLQNALTRADYCKSLADLREFFQFDPEALACDLHPDYASTQLAQSESKRTGKPCGSVQHHHAHIAACLAENSVSLHAPPVLGIALDGMGFGTDGTFWGGEFLLADYRGHRRLATFKPIPLLGGETAVREPWRCTYAHLMAGMGWAQFATNYRELDLFAFLDRKPRELLDGMSARSLNTPLASSCGRLFDAVAAAADLARSEAFFEGQGAMELEAAVDRECLEHEDRALDYPFSIPRLPNGLLYVEPLAMWQALLGDLVLKTPVGVIAARFHRGLARVIVRMADKLAQHAPADAPPLKTVALSGGVFQNRILFEQVLAGLEEKGFTVLTHAVVPSNDGGIALGQAVIAAAQLLQHN